MDKNTVFDRMNAPSRKSALLSMKIFWWAPSLEWTPLHSLKGGAHSNKQLGVLNEGEKH